MDPLTLLLFAALGAACGVVAGLLGVGGGLLFVPLLHWGLPSLTAQPQAAGLVVAVATSLAVIVPTAAASFASHARNRAVDWCAFRRLSLAIVPGVLLVFATIGVIDEALLRLCYVLFVFFIAWRLLRPPTRHRPSADTPWSPARQSQVAMATGLLSSWLGIGGGTLTTPLLLRQGLPIRRAIATSAACGLPLSLTAAATYSLWPVLPGADHGLIYWPVVLPLASGSILGAYWGARQTHRWPQTVLRRAFGGLLLAVAVAMAL